jgi:hypothetical protein
MINYEWLVIKKSHLIYMSIVFFFFMYNIALYNLPFGLVDIWFNYTKRECNLSA